jgi:hypothetical protein
MIQPKRADLQFTRPIAIVSLPLSTSQFFDFITAWQYYQRHVCHEYLTCDNNRTLPILACAKQESGEGRFPPLLIQRDHCHPFDYGAVVFFYMKARPCPS